MTREEAKKELWRYGNLETLSKSEANELLDKIYDDFEKELKEICKFTKALTVLHKMKYLYQSDISIRKAYDELREMEQKLKDNKDERN